MTKMRDMTSEVMKATREQSEWDKKVLTIKRRLAELRKPDETEPDTVIRILDELEECKKKASSKK